MFGKAKNIASMLKNAQSLQKNMEEAKNKLANTVFSSKNGVLSMTGGYQIVDINLHGLTDNTQVANAFKEAHQDCILQIAKSSEEQIKNMSKDFNLDGLLEDSDK
jgi:DNA-binding protein YbaB